MLTPTQSAGQSEDHTSEKSRKGSTLALKTRSDVTRNTKQWQWSSSWSCLLFNYKQKCIADKDEKFSSDCKCYKPRNHGDSRHILCSYFNLLYVQLVILLKKDPFTFVERNQESEGDGGLYSLFTPTIS